MTIFARLRSLIRNLVRGDRVERELDAELRGYLDLVADEKVARGVPVERARREARIEIGGMETVKEEVRAARAGAVLEQGWHDVRYAVRGLRRSPAFAATAILTLGLGVGANTAMFSAVDALLLRQLPVSHPEQLVAPYRGTDASQAAFSFPEYDAIANHTQLFAGMSAWSVHTTWMRLSRELERASVHVVTPNYFEVLGVTPAAGLPFSARAAATNGQIIVSDRLWRTRFGADASVLGRTMTIGTQPMTIIGVAPAGFGGLDATSPADAWITFDTLTLLEPDWNFRDRREIWIQLIGRLRSDVPLAAAESALRGVDLGIAGRPPSLANAPVRLVPAATPVFDPTARETASRLALLVAAVAAFVLLIACANVANLLIVRSAARQRELGVRLAVGASRGRVVRQIVAETGVLSVAGWLVALVVAQWTITAVVALAPRAVIPPGVIVTMDFRIVLFAAVVTLVTGLLCGLVPAWQASRADLSHVMKAGPEGRNLGGVRLRRVLVVAQVALSCVLLAGAGLFIRTLSATLDVQPGYDVDRVVLTTLDFTTAKLAAPVALTTGDRIREAVASLPGVESVALAQIVPFSGAFVARPAVPEGTAIDPARENDSLVPYGVVSDGYFRTLGMPLRGRDFTPADTASAPSVVIVNETLARRYWPSQDPIGKRLMLPAGKGPAVAHEVIGVVPDGKYVALTEEQHPYMYLPLRQNRRPRITLHVRTSGDGAALLGPIRQQVAEINPDVAAYNPITLRGYVDRSIAQPRLVARLLVGFGGIALLVAAVGVYGLTAFTVIRRTREVGLRIALGAQPADVVRMLVRQTTTLVAIGLLLGISGSLLLGRSIESWLFGITSHDPLAYIGAASLLGVTMIIATVVPASRASRVDPVTALRVE